ncbi:L-rhamnose mutarotase [Aquincola sp. S2]|uniref:L-rhamnose mutarotase n=1 Tax=Pseudaquabacterium terrae TaxID=2732868 RepID=A0ABX2ERR9_9BURK|nr:L-rhamnose mutarotase [Aquabacterium terrae]
MQRMGMVIGIEPDRIAEYKRLHADVWPAVMARLAASPRVPPDAGRGHRQRGAGAARRRVVRRAAQPDLGQDQLALRKHADLEGRARRTRGGAGGHRGPRPDRRAGGDARASARFHAALGGRVRLGRRAASAGWQSRFGSSSHAGHEVAVRGHFIHRAGDGRVRNDQAADRIHESATCWLIQRHPIDALEQLLVSRRFRSPGRSAAAPGRR